MAKSASTTPRQAQAELFRAAAQYVEKSNHFYAGADVCVCMCDALFRAAEEKDTIYEPAVALLEEYIGTDARLLAGGGYRWGQKLGDTPEEIRRGRAVALYFMAAMVEAGDA